MNRLRFMIRESDVKGLSNIRVVWTDKRSGVRSKHGLAFDCTPGYWLVAEAPGLGLVNTPLVVDEDTKQVEFDKIIGDGLRILQATARLAGEPELDTYRGFIAGKFDLEASKPMSSKRFKGL